ncbi:glucose-1-phosphate thymidylyltransferase [Haloarcula halobia]|uniref:glucose-1-phosphate thymidylyltransferase n=1 Tax=Haloarcula halobia TaxID=3033388 RepID=UPI0023ED991D|nr:glucose-1-phosphate thymidylyltransferase [Halomicroarcula sp. XH51]
MKGLILSGGTGTRLRPITHTGPKQLIPVANKPVIEYAIKDLKAAGITDIGIVLGNKGRDEIKQLLGDGSDYGVKITYIIQGNPLGLAHAVGVAEDFVDGDDFVVYLGDNILKEGINDLVEGFRKNRYTAGIALQTVDNPQEFGVANLDQDNNVKETVEKPDNPPSKFALIGIYLFSPVVFEIIEELELSWRGELEITDAIQGLLDRDEPVDSHVVKGWWKDTGKPEDILEANRLILDSLQHRIEGEIEDETSVSGRVELKQGSVIESGAVVRGPVSIGPDTTVADGSYIGPYTSIGESCKVAEARIESSVIVGDSDITTSKRIVDSLIGRGTIIGGAEDMLPEGRRFVVGENSCLFL